MADFDGLPVPRRYWSAGAIWLALTMAVLDGAIANVALPTMARELSAARDQSVWVVNGFQLTVVVSLLPLAALGEMIGYRRVFLAGVALFTAASLACALAQSLPILIFTRVVQGLGAGCIMSVNGALVRFTYPSNQLGRGVGLNALVVSAAAAFGPTVASAILALGPWEWLFAVNVPIGVLTFFVGRASLPMSPASGRLDLSSTLLNIATFGFGFIGIDLIRRDGDERLGGAALALATVTGVTLILRSRARPRPLVPIDLLRNKIFALSVITSIASFSAQMLAFVSLPFYLQGVLHRSQVDTGLLMTPWPLAAGVAAAFAGRLELTDQVLLINALDEDAEGALSVAARRIGGPLAFGRIWERLGISAVLDDLLKARAFGFSVERAVFVAARHRLFVSGSDRDCSSWMEDYDIPGAEGLDLHHFYRAMAWLGEELEEKPAGALAPRCLKDLIEERLFDRRRDLFTDLSAVFMDTTSLSFYGEGGETPASTAIPKTIGPISSR